MKHEQLVGFAPVKRRSVGDATIAVPWDPLGIAGPEQQLRFSCDAGQIPFKPDGLDRSIANLPGRRAVFLVKTLGLNMSCIYLAPAN
ncbi:MAG TPA: hypothetical protein P5186_03910 [Candidatus Paceibacterota bacterium]|nr:hypothetical protein [Candidatus Paceibacterota bacterium]